MNYSNDLKLLLTEIKERRFSEGESLPHLSREDLVDMIFSAEQEGYLSRKNTKENIVIFFFDGNFMLNPATFITKAGVEFIDGVDRNSMTQQQFTNTFSGPIQGINIGNNNTTTINNYGYSFEELKQLVDSLPLEDKQIGNNLVDVIDSREIKPGILKKFDTFLKKYPDIASATGKILLAIATSTLPLKI